MPDATLPAPIREFRPNRLIAHPQLQTIIASRGPRHRAWLRRGSLMQALAQPQVFDTGVIEHGVAVRLGGWYSPQPQTTASRGLAVLIHGWQGAHDSTYLYSMACQLHAGGWDVLRLNLRDHGGSETLNRGMFNSARIDEVLGAIRSAQQVHAAAHPSAPLVIVGFSLGGNFALRVALKGPAQGIHPALSVAICPVLDPHAAMQAIDTGPHIFRAYFAGKWRNTLRAKAAAWPGHYDFRRHLPVRGLVGATRMFAEDFTPYGGYEAYAGAYHLHARQLMEAPSPLAVIMAQDDPVIPFRDFAELRATGAVRSFDAPAHGGHCGFIENLRLDSWAEARVMELLRGIAP